MGALSTATNLALQFLEQSIQVRNGKGSSHSYSFWMNPGDGWHKAYPETTGYLLPTLQRASDMYQVPELAQRAAQCAAWLEGIQSKDGWFTAGVYREKPSLFNTAIIAQGLLQYDLEAYRGTIEKAFQWILSQQEQDGLFLNFGYREGYFPAYYTRVAWSMIEGGLRMNNGELLSKGELCLERLLPKFKKERIEDCGFHPDEPPFLHTVGYALRGLIECYSLLNRTSDLPDLWLDRLDQLWIDDKKWPGRLWPHDYTFTCPTGMAQVALCFLRWRKAYPKLEEIVEYLSSVQSKKGPSKGGIPGSHPFWGAYLRGRYPNWATKFYVDLLMELSADIEL